MSYIPPYSYFYNNGGNPYSDGKVLPIAAPRKPNAMWRSYGIIGIILGSLLFILGLSMIPIEVSRILQGSLNRLGNGDYLLYPNYNVDANRNSPQIKNFIPSVLSGSQADLAGKGIVPKTANNPLLQNYPIQDKYLWPWSHAALLFSLVTIAAGIVGILSGCRRTYTSIFGFYTLSLLSAFLSIFLIVYYAVEVYWQLNQNTTLRNSSFFNNLDYSLASTMLALSCAVCVLSFISTVYSGLSAGICMGSKSPLVKQRALKEPKQKKVKNANNNLAAAPLASNNTMINQPQYGPPTYVQPY